MINIDYLPQSLQVRSWEMAWMGTSGLGFVMRFWSSCQLGLQLLEGLTRTGAFVSKGAHTLVLVVGGSLSSSPCGPLHGLMSVFMTWHLASLRVSNPKYRERNGSYPFGYPQHHFNHILFVSSKSLSPTHIQWREKETPLF